MLEFLVKNHIVSLEDIDDIPEDMVVVEECKKYDKELEYFCIAIPLSKKPDIIKMYEKFEPENASHIEKILDDPKGIKVVYTAITRRYSESITDYLYDYFNNDIDELFSYFGYDEIDEPAVEETYPKKQYFETDAEYIDVKEEEQGNTISGIQSTVPEELDRFSESKQEIPAEVVEEENNTFSREEILEFCEMISALDASVSQQLINSIIVLYDSGEEVFATNKVLGLLSQMQNKGLIS